LRVGIALAEWHGVAMIEMLILVWAGLVVVGLFVFCGIARAGLQEDVLFTPRDSHPDS
jgi:hypothetical protein